MGGGNTTPSVTALLCLGELWGGRAPPLQGTRPKPSIRADRGLTVPKGSPVTIWCQGSPQADVYRLYKVGGSGFWEAEAPQDSSNTAGFPFESLSSYDAGRYQCAYHSGDGWSGRSDPLPLVVTGMYRKPTLSAHPGTSVSWGEKVTLRCRSEIWLDTFHLSKEGSLTLAQSLRLQEAATPIQANFTLSPVTSAHNGTYRCYSSQSSSPYLLSQPSDPLELLISGEDAGPGAPGPDPRAALGWGGSEGVTEGGKELSEGWKKPERLPCPTIPTLVPGVQPCSWGAEEG
uniref:Immunoglobulin domain-containing protein n=1 Tax=Catagonus wagneri TaxID=51154 RepID=A0A8C3YLQ8_9CETA